jgi:deoxyadenosine/deoxycytidine kinase
VKSRGRKFEVGITEEYIEEVNQAYHRFFFGYSAGPLLQVNCNDIDFVNNEEDFEKLLDKLSSPIRGKEFFNPLGSN